MRPEERDRLLAVRLSPDQNLYEQPPFDEAVRQAIRSAQSDRVPILEARILLSFWGLEIRRAIGVTAEAEAKVLSAEELSSVFDQIWLQFVFWKKLPKSLEEIGVRLNDPRVRGLGLPLTMDLSQSPLWYCYVDQYVGSSYRWDGFYAPRFKAGNHPATIYPSWLQAKQDKLLGLTAVLPRYQALPTVTPEMEGTSGLERYFRQRRTVDTSPRSATNQ